MKYLTVIALLFSIAACRAPTGPGTLKTDGVQAPQLDVVDQYGVEKPFSEYYKDGPVVLTFLRSFYCPYCRKHLDEIRENHDALVAAGITVVAVSKDDAEDVNEYWTDNDIPFICIPDPDGRIRTIYAQQSRFGLMPAMFVIDTNGIIVRAHYGEDARDIPTSRELIEIVKENQ